MKSSEEAAREASWQWAGEADGAGEAPGDVIGGGGPRLSRRGLLAGAGVLAVGGAVWALGRSGSDGPAPGPAKPVPTAVSGPTPLWTYRGAQAMTPERLVAPPRCPVFLSKAGLQVLDPAGGGPGRLLVFDPPPPPNWPSDAEPSGGKVAIGPEYMFSTESKGHLDAHHLSDPAHDWSLPLPDELSGRLQLTCTDTGALYGYAWTPFRPEEVFPSTRVFAIGPADRTLLWSVAGPRQERPVALATGGTAGLLACARSLGDGAELAVRDAATGRELWTAGGPEGLRWCVAGGEGFLVPDGTGGVRMLGAGGEPGWTHSPARGESWRALPPVPDGVRVFVPRDSGMVTCNDLTTGAVLWSRKLPFPLDSRSRPLVVGGTLYVPGPAAAGVFAIDVATGRLGWAFHDSGPGRDVWSIATDGSRLYAGHDDVLYALATA
ncbi:outer membrane protein assembly factor BamB family protein [Kitasatospora cathayae]|uniref:PQQ-binding-like beta-propeller repeat protein n=1 Tax=Kitasatospora cathayae TaxID=3004092 RepID=A0ABY7PY84_9ACTN|nr:PQQ-binding-like beta-propeller repeat protein [Kitasatospora sp. HUAS 3-15]WBP85380.1 PQQ-binding-like beta-propeller repeat protein [Kitasatospora sp. HUAS 3-15]